MKKWNSKLLTTLTMTISAFMAAQSSKAQAEGGLSLGLVGAASIQNPTVTRSGSSPQVNGQKGYGGGITAEIVMTEGIGLEADALYLNHKFSHDTADIFGSTVESTFTSGYLHVPVLVRYRPIDWLNLGLGGYYSRVVTSWTVGASNFADRTFDYGKNDFGFVAAVGSLIPLSDNLSIMADVRYARSLTNSARQSNDALKFADVQLLLGLRFGLR